MGDKTHILWSYSPTDALVTAIHPEVGVLQISDDEGHQHDEALFDEITL
jgi:hypothetical protein